MKSSLTRYHFPSLLLIVVCVSAIGLTIYGTQPLRNPYAGFLFVIVFFVGVSLISVSIHSFRLDRPRLPLTMIVGLVVLFTTSEQLDEVGFREMIVSTVLGMGLTWGFPSAAWRAEHESIDDRLLRR